MQEGYLSLHLGCMFSGKTTYLIHLLETTGHISKSLYINHGSDSRSSGPYSTNSILLDSNLSSKLNADMIKQTSLLALPDDVLLKYPVICIDEAQFFKDLPEAVLHMVDDLKREVYIAGLSGDYKRKNFGRIHELIPHADKVVILNDTFCSECAKFGRKKHAIFTHRLKDTSGTQLEIGSSNYIPVCRSCYLKMSGKASSTGVTEKVHICANCNYIFECDFLEICRCCTEKSEDGVTLEFCTEFCRNAFTNEN